MTDYDEDQGCTDPKCIFKEYHPSGFDCIYGSKSVKG